MKTDLVLSSAGIIAICVVTFALRSDSDKRRTPKTGLSVAAQKEVAAVESEIDDIEAETEEESDLAPQPSQARELPEPVLARDGDLDWRPA